MWDILSEETDARQGSTATASSPGSAPEEGAVTSSWPWKLLGRTSDIMKPSRFGPAVLAQLREAAQRSLRRRVQPWSRSDAWWLTPGCWCSPVTERGRTRRTPPSVGRPRPLPPRPLGPGAHPSVQGRSPHSPLAALWGRREQQRPWMCLRLPPCPPAHPGPTWEPDLPPLVSCGLLRELQVNVPEPAQLIYLSRKRQMSRSDDAAFLNTTKGKKRASLGREGNRWLADSDTQTSGALAAAPFPARGGVGGGHGVGAQRAKGPEAWTAHRTHGRTQAKGCGRCGWNLGGSSPCSQRNMHPHHSNVVESVWGGGVFTGTESLILRLPGCQGAGTVCEDAWPCSRPSCSAPAPAPAPAL